MKMPSQTEIKALVDLFRSGQMGRLENTCANLLKQFPKDLTILNLMGLACQSQGKIARAIQAFNAIISLRPDCAEAFNNRGVAFKALGQPEKAARDYEQAVHLNPAYAEAYCNLADLLRELEMVEKAAENYEKAVRFKPGYAKAFNGLGRARYTLGQLEEAVESYETAIRLNPDYGVAHNNLGIAFKCMGQPEKAITCYDGAIRLKHGFAEAHNNRGNALLELERFQEAEKDFREATRIRPEYAVAYNNLGVTLKKLDQIQPALEAFETAIRISPDYPEFHCNRGHSLVKLDHPRQAIDAYDRAIQLNPDYAEAYNHLGVAFQKLGRLEDALSALDTSLRLSPLYPEAFNNRGIVLKELERFEEALACYDKALSIKPDVGDALVNKGIAYEALGKFGKAEQCYLKALQMKPDFFEVYRNLSKVKTFCPGDPDIERMLTFIRENSVSEKERVHLSFALGKAFTDTGDYATAFRHYKEGNRLRKIELGYRIDADKKLFTRIRSIFQRPVCLPEATLSRPRSRPIFILGMPRSGTTLVEQILASHSAVHAGGELRLLSDTLKQTPGAFTDLTGEPYRTIRQQYLDGLKELGASPTWITDKMPLNFRWIGFIVAALPEARIIHLNRQAPAVCWSIFKHCFSSNGNGYAYDLKDVAGFYHLYKNLMAFWHEKFPGKIYDLNYEALTENQEGETRKLLDYIGLDWEDGCLDFHKTRRLVRTASSLQVKQKMYQGSSEKWRNFEPFLAPMLDRLERMP